MGKNKALPFLITVLLIIFLCSCSKKNNPNANPPPVIMAMSGTINGAGWEATSVTDTTSNGLLIITGKLVSDTTTSVQLIIGSSTTGIYAINNNTYIITYIKSFGKTTSFENMKYGTIDINSVSGGILSGNFSGGSQYAI